MGRMYLVSVGGGPFTCFLLMCEIIQAVVQIFALGNP